MDIDKLLEGRVNALVRRERNKYKRLFFKYKKALNELKASNFTCSYDSNDSDEYYSESDDEEFQDIDDCEELKIDMIDLNDPETKRRIFDNINKNYNEGNGSRYSKESKLFAYSLFMRSPSTYNYLRQVFPFPCEKTLNRKFQPKVDEHTQMLTNSLYASKRFDIQKKYLQFAR